MHGSAAYVYVALRTGESILVLRLGTRTTGRGVGVVALVGSIGVLVGLRTTSTSTVVILYYTRCC